MENEEENCTKLALQFGKYADILTGYACAQAIFFAYEMGKHGEICKDVVENRCGVGLGIALATLLFVGLFWFCRVSELRLRKAAGHGELIQKCAANSYLVRAGLVILANLIVGCLAVLGDAPAEYIQS